ncbi:CBASS cGAMP-activated phospholipase [Corallococcus macrosporus]|uniref:Patatin n=1 Tax=Corallococcus macrosporus DSM 14697 TaxID=1189310 RepID=A0A250K1A8_9BACT|nr:CBASS cGAMP-activated phospholipase [Corallococcus macrosporus]ATB49884.1 patatin [Corallococcus macrosporus DSM 14697]
MDRKRFRILSLDGGGIRGAYTAAVLASIEETSGKRLVDHFDLIVGTSTGAITAVALGMGISASKLLEFYLNYGPSIFPRARGLDRMFQGFRWFARAKYKTEPLEQALSEVLGNRLFGESQCRLAIPSYDIVSNCVRVFKTAHGERFRQDYKRSAVEVIRATTAAPTYFDAIVTAKGELLIDGGVWANCPSMVGVAEALDLGVALSDINLLSVGTLGEAQDFARAARGGGIFHYARNLYVLGILMDAQARGAWSQTRLLLSNRATRITQTVPAGLYALDDTKGLQDLVARGRSDGRHNTDFVLREFLNEPVTPFVPIYSTSTFPAL